jgi:hypothetical protein
MHNTPHSTERLTTCLRALRGVTTIAPQAAAFVASTAAAAAAAPGGCEVDVTVCCMLRGQHPGPALVLQPQMAMLGRGRCSWAGPQQDGMECKDVPSIAGIQEVREHHGSPRGRQGGRGWSCKPCKRSLVCCGAGTSHATAGGLQQGLGVKQRGRVLLGVGGPEFAGTCKRGCQWSNCIWVCCGSGSSCDGWLGCSGMKGSSSLVGR